MTPARETIQAIYRSAIAAVDPEMLVRDALSQRGDGGQLQIQGRAIAIPPAGVFLIAIGKAGQAMVNGAATALAPDLRGGLVVTKQAAVAGNPAIEVLEGSHPVPDARSLEAGRRVLDFARRVPDGALVLCLISGGGSALVENLREGVTLDQLQDITSRLLSEGASIHELNAVRSRLSAIKGGGLLRALRHADVVNLVVSDVLGDDLAVIASGPSVQPAGAESAEDVLGRYGLWVELPERLPEVEAGPLASKILANVERVVHAAAHGAVACGLEPVILTRRMQGEARAAGRMVAAIAGEAGCQHSPLRPGCCLLAGGETTVTVRGDGVGGRNTEAALAAALEFAGRKGVSLGFLATDGDDGVSGAAGAIVDGATIRPELRRAARQALDRNDSYGFLAGVGAAWSPGATGTNVNDLVIGIIDAL